MTSDVRLDSSGPTPGRRPSRREFLTRVVAAGLAAPAFGGVLAACTGGGGFDKTSGAGPTAAKKFTGQLVISTVINPPKAAQQALTDAYHKVQPGVEIVWETQDFSGSDAYTQFLTTQLAAANPRPDFVSGVYAKTYSGYVDLDQYRNAIDPYTSDQWSKDINFDLGGSRNALGQLYQASTGVSHYNWTYNKDMFDKAGVQPPTNWDEFVDVCAKLKAANITPIAANFQWIVPQWLTEIYFDQYHVDWVNTVRAQKGDWNYNPDLDGKFTYQPDDGTIHSKYTYSPQRFWKGIKDRTLRFDTPEMAELVANLAKIFPKYATSDFFVMTDPYPSLLKSQAAMIIADPQVTAKSLTSDFAAKSATPFTPATFETPAMQGPLVKCKPRSIEPKGGDYVSIIKKNSEQTAMAIDFAMFWLSRAGYQPYLNAEIQAGLSVGTMDIDGLTFPPAVEAQNKAIKFVGNAEVVLNQVWTAGADPTSKADLQGMLKDALQGKLTPQAYATGLQKYFQDNFDKMIAKLSLTEDDIDNPSRRPSAA
jgi:ABC-type glycerol-3-phosphate transport system substrate-binding protein